MTNHDYGLKCNLCGEIDLWDRFYGECHKCGNGGNVFTKHWKAKLRAWLIDLVREAIRVEFPIPTAGDSLAAIFETNKGMPATLSKPNTAVETPLEPSFEQMQAESIKAQVKYYEPK